MAAATSSRLAPSSSSTSSPAAAFAGVAASRSSPHLNDSRPSSTGSASTAKGRSGTQQTAGAVSAPNGTKINTVTYRNATIKALIDPSLPVGDVIRQLCANAHLGVQEPPALFALRDDEDEELIDDSNMAKKIDAGRNFKLCSSPTIEAVEMVDKLSSRDDRVLKMATYTLQRLIRERAFSAEFLRRGGLDELMEITKTFSGGNTLAYTLTSIQNLMESSDEGWEGLDGAFIKKVVNTLVKQERINVCRPATAILKKLVVSGPDNAPQEQDGKVVADGDASGDTEGSATMRLATRAAEGDPNGAGSEGVYRFGFDVVYREIVREPDFLSTLMQRLSSADTTLCLYSLSLINSLMRHVSDNLFDAFTSELERLGVSKAVARLMDSNRGEELTSSILEYQINVIRVAHHRLRTAVTPSDKRHVSALSFLWLQARIPETTTAEGSTQSFGGTAQKFKWRRLGFEHENVAKDFVRTGWLGLECCEHFVRSDTEAYAKIILEQVNRPISRRCPWGRASLECVEILCDHYDIESGYSTSTRFQPLLLSFHRLHGLALRFFLRMWYESGAAASDFARVSALTRSQVKEALRDESTKTWFDVEHDFLQSDYRIVRDRQMRELEVEDDFSSKPSIRNLRARLYRESYEFVRQQRIQCLLEGAWFRTTPLNSFASSSDAAGGQAVALGGRNSKGFVPANPRPWRFYRLSPNKKYLYYCEASERGPIRSGLDDLPEKIDLNQVTDISLQSAAAANAPSSAAATGTLISNNNNGTTATNNNSSNLTFSLLRAPDVSLADFVALNASQYSEWTDGLSMLRGEGGMVSTKETADYIQMLTDIGVKVKLLDLTGEAVDIPSTVAPPPLPVSTSFFFADL